MRRYVAICSILLGALVGGVVPGAFVAFAITASVANDFGAFGEPFCFALNWLFGVGGALLCAIAAPANEPGASRRGVIILSMILGTAASCGGYFWLDWELSHAFPPF